MNRIELHINDHHYQVSEADLLMILTSACSKMNEDFYPDSETDIELAEWESDLIDKCYDIKSQILNS